VYKESGNAMAKNYYQIIGVERDASLTEIKRAFRRLAHQYHPDVCDEPDAEEKFKIISEAYEVLADDTKRADYDMSGGAKEMYKDGFDWNDFTKYDDIRDIFGAYATPSEIYTHRKRYQGPQMGRDLVYPVAISLKEAFKGTSRPVEIPDIVSCTTCKGTGGMPGTGTQTCPVCGGLGQVKQIENRGMSRHMAIQACMRCLGKGTITGKPCKDCDGSGKVSGSKTIEVKIPAGVTDGTTLRLPGQGADGLMGGRRGDVYVKVQIVPDERFEREGDDLVIDVYISYTQAALGGSIEVETVEEKVKLEIPSGTQTHTMLKLKGKGLPHVNKEGRGDIYVRVVIRTPQDLTPKQKELLQQMEKDGGEATVPPEGSPKKDGKRGFKRFKFFK
jgi:molecular chaperone DnaJ